MFEAFKTPQDTTYLHLLSAKPQTSYKNGNGRLVFGGLNRHYEHLRLSVLISAVSPFCSFLTVRLCALVVVVLVILVLGLLLSLALLLVTIITDDGAAALRGAALGSRTPASVLFGAVLAPGIVAAVILLSFGWYLRSRAEAKAGRRGCASGSGPRVA